MSHTCDGHFSQRAKEKELVDSVCICLSSGDSESCVDDVCLVTHIEGVCHKGLMDWEQAERCFLTVIDR